MTQPYRSFWQRIAPVAGIVGLLLFFVALGAIGYYYGELRAAAVVAGVGVAGILLVVRPFSRGR